VTAVKRYLVGLAVVGVIGLALTWLLGPGRRNEVAFGVVIGLLIQAPLGWWTIRSIGTERFQLAWVAGMLIRLAAIAVAGLVLAPEYGWNTAATLAALVGTLLVLLLVEVLSAVRVQSGNKSR
jgi:heme A synthase